MNRLRKIVRFGAFLGFFVREVVTSNMRLVRDILGSPSRLHPGFIELTLEESTTDRQCWLLATCISMTPGTLSLLLEKERRVLLIHTLHVEAAEEILADLKQRFERKVRDVF